MNIYDLQVFFFSEIKHTDSGVSSKENYLSEYAKDPNYADNSDDDNKDGGNAPRYPQVHIFVSSQAAPLNLTYLTLYISNISAYIAPAHQNTTDSTHPGQTIRRSHEFQG